MTAGLVSDPRGDTSSETVLRILRARVCFAGEEHDDDDDADGNHDDHREYVDTNGDDDDDDSADEHEDDGDYVDTYGDFTDDNNALHCNDVK